MFIPRRVDAESGRPRTLPVPKSVREFLHTEAAGGVVLLLGAVAALAWANSPWHASYTSFWHTPVNLELGPLSFDEDLRELVDEALMAIFFFVVGLEIKRELVVGELQSWKTASLPAVGALGGMVVPALLYVALAGGGDAAKGWGIPMATDIAFAVGVVALLGSRVPGSLKLFLLTLAIVDDLGAIVVIAAFYSEGISFAYLAGAAATLVLVVLAQRARIIWMPLYIVLGATVWYLTYRSGVHATIAGAILGLLAPARPLAAVETAREWAEDLADDPNPRTLTSLTRLAKNSLSVAERLQHNLHPWTSFGVIPLFALANAGVRFEAGAFEADGATGVVLGVVVGLVVGKTVGIAAASWLAVRFGIGTLPRGVRWSQMLGIAAAAGIGFTVSLFIAGLAFPEPELEAAAKIGIVIASALASVAGTVLLTRAARSGAPPVVTEVDTELATP